MYEVEFKALQIHYYTQKAWFINNSMAIFAVEKNKTILSWRVTK